MKKTLLTILCTVLVCSCVMGATLAYLADKTDPVVNTFTVGKVDIELTETTGDTYKMIPGSAIAKDPYVIVKAGSEACYVFVEIDKDGNFDNYMTFEVAEGWTALTGFNGVYYRTVNATNADTQPMYVLAGGEGKNPNGQVVVNTSVINGTTATPTLTFTAYAVQQENLSVADAWTQAQNAANYPTVNP